MVIKRREFAGKVIGGKLTPDNLSRFKRLSEQDRLSRIRETVLSKTTADERPFSLSSLEFKLSVVRELEKSLECNLFPPFALMRRIDETYELAVEEGRIYHYTAASRCHPNEDSLISLIQKPLQNIYSCQIHALFDGATSYGEGWGRKASRMATEILRNAVQLGLVISPDDVVSLLEGINTEIYLLGEGKAATTATVALIQDDRLTITSIGNSYAIIVTPTGASPPLTKDDAEPYFLGVRTSIATQRSEGPFREGWTLMLASDGFADLCIPGNNLLIARILNPYVTKPARFSGFGPSVRSPKNPDKKELGPVDDASVILVHKNE